MPHGLPSVASSASGVLVLLASGAEAGTLARLTPRVSGSANHASGQATAQRTPISMRVALEPMRMGSGAESSVETREAAEHTPSAVLRTEVGYSSGTCGGRGSGARRACAGTEARAAGRGEAALLPAGR